MTIASTIADSFERSFGLYRDLVDSLDEATLGLKLPRLPSNTVGSQLWRVAGARESFDLAIQADERSGFSGSLDTATEKRPVSEALRNSAGGISSLLGSMDSSSGVQNRLIIDLPGHETDHQGQLIRYLYGLRLTIPESWKVQYALG
jgi:hypothetical protein